MTTATDTAAAKVDLAAANGQAAPKRRGRPPGSKNKPKDGATPTRTRRAAAPKEAATPRVRAPKVHAILVTNEGIEVLHQDGSTEIFPVALTGAPLFDRRK